jgi:Mn-containing catalase
MHTLLFKLFHDVAFAMAIRKVILNRAIAYLVIDRLRSKVVQLKSSHTTYLNHGEGDESLTKGIVHATTHNDNRSTANKCVEIYNDTQKNRPPTEVNVMKL